MAREIMKLCDKSHKGTITSCQMQTYLAHTKHQVFLNFMMRKNLEKYAHFDANEDGVLDLDEVRTAVLGYLDSDMYGAEVRKRQLHPPSGKPAWKHSGVAPTREYKDDYDQEILAEHMTKVKHGKALTQAQNSPQGKRSPNRGRMGSPVRKTRASNPTRNIGQHHGGSRWIEMRQIAFATKKLLGVKKTGPPNFKEAHNVLTPAQVEAAKGVFAVWDKDHNGGIDKTELAAAMDAVIVSVQDIQAKTAGHSSVKATMHPEKIATFVSHVFELADHNHDSILDEDEFVAVYNTIAINCINFNDIDGAY